MAPAAACRGKASSVTFAKASTDVAAAALAAGVADVRATPHGVVGGPAQSSGCSMLRRAMRRGKGVCYGGLCGVGTHDFNNGAGGKRRLCSKSQCLRKTNKKKECEEF